MPLILGAQSAVATGYSIDNSCLFIPASNDDLARVLGTPTNRDKWTLSAWVKKSAPTGDQAIMQMGPAANMTHILLSPLLEFTNKISSSFVGRLTSNASYRDPSAWYHVLCVWDSDNGVAGDRMKAYINGAELTSFLTDTNPTSGELSGLASGNTMTIGAASSVEFDGYMADVALCDGQAYTPSDFGEFNADSPTIWQPIDISGLTFGDEGFHLDFGDSADLGADVSGNSNDFTGTNMSAANQATDTPTNSFSTWNPLYVPTSSLPTFADGNTTTVHATTSGGWRTMESTLGVSSGKWYWECIGGNGSGHIYNGVCSLEWLEEGNPGSMGPEGEMGYHIAQPSYGVYALNGALAYSNTSGFGTTVDSYTSTADNTDYWSVYVDLDNHKIYWSINGAIQNSGTGFDLQTGFTYIPSISLYNSEAAGGMGNFGKGTFGTTLLTGTTYADNDGYGIFKYSPNYGGAATFDSSAKNFMALCTKNLGAYGG